MSRSLPYRRVTRMGGMYKKISTAGTRAHNQIDGNAVQPKAAPKLSDFEKEYEKFIAEQKALLAAKENEVKEVVVEEKPAEVIPEEPILAPEQSFVETEVTEAAEPIKVEVVEETPAVEEPVVAPVKTSRKRKTTVTTTEE